MSAIKVNSLSFHYLRETPVLKDISFEVHESDSWAIIGKNGSGKSTLLKCISGLLQPSAGSISVEGKPVTHFKLKELAKKIAYVPQAGNRQLAPYSVREFIMLGRFPYQGFFSLPGLQDRTMVEDSLKLTDTDTLGDRLLHTLSGGELQRVFLAAAVAQKTGILLLDEPMSFLDPLHQAMMQRALDRIREEFSATIITVTHDVNLAVNRFSHICALSEGRAFFVGTTAQFKENGCNLLRDIYGISFSDIACYDGNTKRYFPEGSI